MSVLAEFREFAVRGNVIDLAVGIVIGTAFGKIVNSLVNDVIMPPIGILINGVDFKSLAIMLKHGPDAQSTVTLNYGNFVQTVIEFLIIAWSVFLMVKVLNRIRRLGEKPQPVVEKGVIEGPPQ
ncbi:MAG: large-conductance mechanosensitive channel protein MscL [Phycisphaerae bacterium]|nr:large-conductance mechanosensitive channel protein MscL [Phycisphaerae bacterium]